MPNPVQFFIDASEILKEGGVLNIAIPISTRCLDFSRPLSTTGEILDAYIYKNKKPSFGDFFDHIFSTMSVINEKNESITLNDMTFDFEKLIFNNELTYDSYKHLVNDYNNSPYKDSHIWQFNLDSFLLIFEDLLMCKIIEKLPDEQKEIVKLRFFQNFSFREIAEMNNISINTALGRVRYSIKNLRKEMNKTKFSKELQESY